MSFLAIMKGGIDPTKAYSDARKASEELIATLATGARPTTGCIDEALRFNKDLRRIYDAVGRRERGRFDDVYRPVGGWDLYYEMNADELHLVEFQQELEEQILSQKK